VSPCLHMSGIVQTPDTPPGDGHSLLAIAARRLADASTVGTATHQLIGLLALRHPADLPARHQLTVTARGLLSHGRSPSARQAMRVAVISLAGVYLQRFWPRGARLIACELVIGDSAIDLLWLQRDGAMFVDELKTGIAASELHAPTVAQARTQADECARLLGESFLGVRVALLRRPVDSFFVPAQPATARRRPPPVRPGDRWAHIRAPEQGSTDDS
jgi:hypothetical protein